MPTLRVRKRPASPCTESSPDGPKEKKPKVEPKTMKIKEEISEKFPDRSLKNLQTYEDEDDENEISEYEIRRMKNIRENAEFFAELGFHETKAEMQKSIGRKKDQKEKPTKIKREKPPPAPRRVSLRIKRIDPEGIPLPPEPTMAPPVEEHPRKPPGPLTMADILLSSLTKEDHTLFMKSVQGMNKGKAPVSPSDQPLQSFIEGFKKISINEDRIRKVVPDRIFSLELHPSPDKLLVAAGDKWGKIGLWDVQCKPNIEDHDGVVAYHPHSRPVGCVRFSPYNWSTVYSCSYDGTMRGCNLEKGVFDEIYTTPEDDDNLLRCIDFTSAFTMLVAQQDGDVALIDTRTKGVEAAHLYWLHSKSIRTVSVHPVNKDIFVTSSTDNTIQVWDIRLLKSERKKNHCLDAISHGKSVDSAYFSPITGNYILSSSIDNRISHDNNTGRWLTNFRPTWHPAREDMLVVGSMNRPRQVEIYGVEGRPLHILSNPDYLGSVCCLNVIHPTRNVVVGGNSSGKVHVFM